LAGKDLSQAVDAAGGSVVAIASVFNGLGRLIWSWLSDSLGRKKVFSIMFATQAALYIFIPHINDYHLFMAVACYLLSCYGGGFATMPAFAADSFGTKQIGRIYGSMLTAWSAAGILGPFTFAYVKKTTQNFTAALYMSSCLLVLGFILSRLYKKPSHRSWVHFTDTNKHIVSSMRP
jgi:OFA family oxalate/formate antiporter-like MFS transporter